MVVRFPKLGGDHVNVGEREGCEGSKKGRFEFQSPGRDEVRFWRGGRAS